MLLQRLRLPLPLIHRSSLAHATKNPINVSIYPCGTNPGHPYQVLGLEAVSKYNLVGIKRQEGNIRDTLRKVAASMGGDAIIDLKYDKKIVKGTVITYDGKPNSKSSA